MTRELPWRLLLVLLVCCGAAAAREATSEPPVEETRGAMILSTVEGVVREIRELPAEGEVTVLAARLDDGDSDRLVLLAPRSVLDEAGFELQVGDRLRARVFSEAGVDRVYSQKIMNLSRRRLLRLRTLRHEPLWDVSGRWQSRADQAAPKRQRVRRRPPVKRHRPPQRRPPPRPSPPG